VRHNKKHLDFELNLVPFIDLLSVCICFLLITAVWLNVGSMNVKQAVGGQAAAEAEKKPLLMVSMEDNGDVNLDVKESNHLPANLKRVKVEAMAGKFNTEMLEKVLAEIKQAEPNLRTALIQPKSQTVYEDIVGLMDQFRKSGMIDLGIVPL
jgi:biopolymer transport protein TolR